MKKSIFIIPLLVSCTPAAHLPESSQAALLLAAPKMLETIDEEGTEFTGKFATSSALNSTRTFSSEYFGTVRITLYKNSKIDCYVYAEGMTEDLAPLEAVSMLCSGRLQNDGSFAFQGVTLADTTFTLSGTVHHTEIQGELLLGEDFATLEGGILFIATRSESP